MVQTPTAGVLFLWVCRDSREAAQGVQPLVAAKPPYRSAGKSPCAEISPRQSAHARKGVGSRWCGGPWCRPSSRCAIAGIPSRTSRRRPDGGPRRRGRRTARAPNRRGRTRCGGPAAVSGRPPGRAAARRGRPTRAGRAGGGRHTAREPVRRNADRIRSFVRPFCLESPVVRRTTGCGGVFIFCISRSFSATAVPRRPAPGSEGFLVRRAAGPAYARAGRWPRRPWPLSGG